MGTPLEPLRPLGLGPKTNIPYNLHLNFPCIIFAYANFKKEYKYFKGPKKCNIANWEVINRNRYGRTIYRII